MKKWKGALSLVVSCATLVGSAVPAEVFAETVQVDDYSYEGKWIWSSDEISKGQWVDFRKEVSLKKVPETAMARIAVDSKYWLWINGEMVVFEGMVKNGPDPENMDSKTVGSRAFCLMHFWEKTVWKKETGS